MMKIFAIGLVATILVLIFVHPTKDEDLILQYETVKQDTTKVDTTAFIKRDTTPYKGKWVDISR